MKKHTYEVIGSGVGIDGWYEWQLQRDDGKIVKVKKNRLRLLRAEGRLKE